MKFSKQVITQGVLLCCTFFSFIHGESFSGVTEPFQSSTISSIVSGRITAIIKKEGDIVKTGESIITLNNDVEKAEESRMKLIADDKSEVTSAKLLVEMHKKDYEATKELYETAQSVSKEEFLKKELNWKLAQVDYERLNLKEKREKIEHSAARAQLRKRTIRAPFSGIIVTHHLRIGESCTPQQPLVKIVNISKCRFVSYIGANNSSSIKKGTPVRIQVRYGKQVVEKKGVIEFVAPVYDASSGLRKVKAIFDNSDGKIKPGITGKMIVDAQ